MQSAILYSSLIRQAGSTAIYKRSKNSLVRTTIYIRAEMYDGDVDEALNHASPRVGETVLNTIPISDELVASARGLAYHTLQKHLEQER